MERFPAISNLMVELDYRGKRRFLAYFMVEGRVRSVNFGTRYEKTAIDGADEITIEKRRKSLFVVTNYNKYRTYMIGGSPNSFVYWLLW